MLRGKIESGEDGSSTMAALVKADMRFSEAFWNSTRGHGKQFTRCCEFTEGRCTDMVLRGQCYQDHKALLWVRRATIISWSAAVTSLSQCYILT